MARIKLAYIGGGSTRAPGTMASFIAQGQNFQGSEVVLIDLDAERLAILRRTVVGPVGPQVPASYLQRAAHVTVIADRAACPIAPAETPADM